MGLVLWVMIRPRQMVYRATRCRNIYIYISLYRNMCEMKVVCPQEVYCLSFAEFCTMIVAKLKKTVTCLCF
jgi:hypothetical protein